MSDYTIVYFNGIERGFSVPSTVAEFSIGNMAFSIKWYGVLIAVGYLLALIACTHLAKRAKINVDALYDVIIWGTLAGILGARIYYVLFNLDYYLANPQHIMMISEGGLAIYGGVIGSVLAIFAVCRFRKINPIDVMDLAAVGFLIGQGVGRWGNYTNQEAFGYNTTLPWGMMSNKTAAYLIENQDFMVAHGMTVEPYTGVHPTFLYESLWCLIGFILLYIMFRNHRKFRGQVALSYGVWYGFERSIVEGLRTDSLYIPHTNIRVSQVLSIALCLICLVLLIVKSLKYKKNPTVIVMEEPAGEENTNEQEEGKEGTETAGGAEQEGTEGSKEGEETSGEDRSRGSDEGKEEGQKKDSREEDNQKGL